ncbi:TerC/Alx family metal homeostasis membrane protein [Candidatus Korarchaeum cryptofilum]|uniref:Integral membrane protein TerC n=1 Tax=Korarchaeum cryptofilum (strain OPF8) TaxID=374847 RepID=B1L541_KORCO|nr:TerC/Alx family metal homeostasis membrane protein [Candidatus Korarchaeum cryptofilum]ACB07570.1 Integral membrane protein TerC [Candidatus Korarchaeum cryptofilum OPF8]
MEVSDPFFWILFHGVIITFLLIDLRHYRHVEMSFRDSLKWVLIWVSIGLSFSVIIFHNYGVDEFIKYITAYVTEYLLSMDNVFVFLAIFTYFAVPYNARPLVLFLGIIFAALFRATFIIVGVTLLQTYHWMVYVFGAVLIYSGYKMAKGGAESVDPGKNRVVQFAKKFLPLTHEYEGQKFIVKRSSSRFFTPLILVLIAIETTDIMFAFDSVPAVLAITREFFTAYTSNIMAILGLRSLYFLLEHGVRRLKNLGKGLAVYLVYLGIAFLLTAFEIDIPSWVSLAIIGTILLWAYLTSRGEAE